MEKLVNKPIVKEVLNNNLEHSRWILVDKDTGEELWSEKASDDEIIIIGKYKIRRDDIYNIRLDIHNHFPKCHFCCGQLCVDIFGDVNRKPKTIIVDESYMDKQTKEATDAFEQECYSKLEAAIKLWKGE